jgi:hypothetical protein
MKVNKRVLVMLLIGILVVPATFLQWIWRYRRFRRFMHLTQAQAPVMDLLSTVMPVIPAVMETIRTWAGSCRCMPVSRLPACCCPLPCCPWLPAPSGTTISARFPLSGPPALAIPFVVVYKGRCDLRNSAHHSGGLCAVHHPAVGLVHGIRGDSFAGHPAGHPDGEHRHHSFGHHSGLLDGNNRRGHAADPAVSAGQ